MQKATFASTFPHIVSSLYLQSLHFLQRPNHKSSIQSLISRFCVHETLQINQSNSLIFNPAFVQGLKRIITFMPVDRPERYLIIDRIR